jgi:predicted PurR-regulated permease PerM
MKYGCNSLLEPITRQRLTIEKEHVMEIIRLLGKIAFLILLIASFCVLGCFTLNASCQLLSNAQNLIDQTKQGESGGDATKLADAIRLQKEVYESVIKEVLSPLLSALLAGFIAYVAGNTVGTVSYNLAEAKKSSGQTSKQFELL